MSLQKCKKSLTRPSPSFIWTSHLSILFRTSMIINLYIVIPAYLNKFEFQKIVAVWWVSQKVYMYYLLFYDLLSNLVSFSPNKLSYLQIIMYRVVYIKIFYLYIYGIYNYIILYPLTDFSCTLINYFKNFKRNYLNNYNKVSNQTFCIFNYMYE